MHNLFRFDGDLKTIKPWSVSQWSHTDLQRMKKGRLSAQVSKTKQNVTLNARLNVGHDAFRCQKKTKESFIIIIHA